MGSLRSDVSSSAGAGGRVQARFPRAEIAYVLFFLPRYGTSSTLFLALRFLAAVN
jgi:hypothetical protein